MKRTSVVKDTVGNYQVVLQMSENSASSRIMLPASQAMDLAVDLIRASLDARFRNANADVAPDDGVPA